MRDNTVTTSSFREEPVVLNDDGVLPPGIHEMTVDEIGSLFGRFQNSALERLDAEELKPFEYSIVSNRRLKRIYGFDVLDAPEGSDTYEHYLSYFSRDKERGGGATKGLVRLRFE